jgi:hypothetical protein
MGRVLSGAEGEPCCANALPRLGSVWPLHYADRVSELA